MILKEEDKITASSGKHAADFTRRKSQLTESVQKEETIREQLDDFTINPEVLLRDEGVSENDDTLEQGKH